MRRRRGRHLDSGRGSVRRSWGIVARVSDAVRVRFAGSRVVVPSMALTFVVVAPLTAAGADAVAAGAVAAYPFFHLWHRYRK